MNRTALWLALLLCILLQGGAEWPRALLLVNAQVLTMDAGKPLAAAVLVQGQHIVAVGSAEDLRALAPSQVRVLDMQGQTILPGFIDAHSHFPSAGLARAGLDLAPPPVGTVASLKILLARVAASASLHKPGSWIIGFNYDDAALDRRRHPTRDELDRAAPHHPVYLWHRSGHMGVANSLALALLGYEDVGPEQKSTAAKVNPAYVGRDPAGRLTGLLQETAAPKLGQLLKELPLGRLLNTLLLARDEYLAAGVTTLQNGFADRQSMQVLWWAQRLGVLPQRVLVWPSHDKLEQPLVLSSLNPENEPSRQDSVAFDAAARALDWSAVSMNFRVGAIKLVADGSPQGQTAWLTEPYEMTIGATDQALDPDFRGFPAMPESQLKAWVERYHEAGLQLAIHGNGDASIDLIIAALTAANERYPRTDARHIVVHAQTIRWDQLKSLKALDATVSFFPAHTFYWGDWYRDRLLGAERAARISPLASADYLGVRYTIHSDAPVTPMRPMQMLWSATQRRTLSGKTLGAAQAISRERALRALTIDAAWQNHLESDRGSLEAGKLADLIVLDKNPLLVEDVRQLRVQQVWIGGREVYRWTPADVS